MKSTKARTTIRVERPIGKYAFTTKPFRYPARSRWIMSRWRWNSPRRSVARSCFRIFRATNTARQSSIGLEKREEWVLASLPGAAVWHAYETGRTNLVKGMEWHVGHGTPRRKRSVRTTFGEAEQLLDAPKHGRGVPTGSLLQLEMLAVEQQCHCPIERLFVCHNRTFSSELRGGPLLAGSRRMQTTPG